MRRLTEPAARAAGRALAAAVLLAAAGLRADPPAPAARPMTPRAAAAPIRGVVVDAADGQPLPGAAVEIVGHQRGTLAGDDGAFSMPGLPPGDYELLVTHVGYAPLRLRVRTPDAGGRPDDAGAAVAADRPGGVEARLHSVSVPVPGVVVSATRRPQSLAEAPVSIAVTQADQILLHNAFTLSGPVGYVPGVSQVGGHVSVRGSSGYSRGVGSRVLLLLDGSPLLAADSGDIKWDVIPVDEVERVEVVKGAGSALYGTGALGGVINVLTRSPAARPRTRVRLVSGLYSQPAYGSWRWRDEPMYLAGVDLSHSRQLRGLGLTAAVGHKRTTGYEENDDFRRYNAYLKAAAALGERTRWTGLASWSLDDHGVFLQWRSRTEPLRVPPGDATAHTASWKLALQTAVDRLVSPATAVRLKGFYFLTDVDNSRAAGGFATVGHQVGAELQVDGGFRPGVRAVAGVTGILDAVRSPADFAGRRQAVNLAGFGQVVAGVTAGAEAALGLRYDLHGRRGGGAAGVGPCAAAGASPDRWERQLSPQLGLSWQPVAGTRVRASAGRGFRAPSITEAFAQASASGVLVCPNPDLTSEESWSGEVGVRQWLGPRMLIDVALFWSAYEDLVEARPEPDPAGAVPRASFRNLSEARIRGLELEHRAALPARLRWEAAYTFLDAVENLRPDEPLPPYGSQDLVPGESAPLPYRARHQASLALAGPVGPVEAGISFQYSSRFARVSGLFPEGDRDLLPVYLVDVHAGRAFGAVQAQVRIDNLLQYHYVLSERELRPLRRLSLSLLGTL